MRKNLIIVALVVVNAFLVIIRPRPHNPNVESSKPDIASVHLVVALTVNRILHEQLAGNWPRAYGATMEEVRKFEEEIVSASKQGCTDWTQYKR